MFGAAEQGREEVECLSVWMRRRTSATFCDFAAVAAGRIAVVFEMEVAVAEQLSGAADVDAVRVAAPLAGAAAAVSPSPPPAPARTAVRAAKLTLGCSQGETKRTRSLPFLHRWWETQQAPPWTADELLQQQPAQ